MRGIIVVPFVIALLVLGSTIGSLAVRASSAPTPSSATTDAAAKRKLLREGWPDTPAGIVAGQWVLAFSTGEDAMREFLKQNVGEKSLAERSVSTRVENYRKLRERYGKLMLASVAGEKKGELTVKLMAEDASTHTFVFTVETQAPHKLISVGIMQLGFSHGGGGFHH